MTGWLLGLGKDAFDPNTSWGVEFGWPRAALVLAVLVAGAFSLGLYLRERSVRRRGAALALGALRMVALGVVVSYLADARLSMTRRESVQSVVRVLVDRSLSMTVRGQEYADAEDRLRAARLLEGDDGIETLSPAREGIVRAATRYEMARAILAHDAMGLSGLAGTHTVETFVFGDGLRPVEDPASWPAPDVPVTRLGDDVRRALQTEGGAVLAGLVVLTDGQSTRGEDPLAAARFAGPQSRRVPLILVPLGSPDEPRDIEVRAIYTNPVALVGGDPVPVRAVVRHSGYAGEAVEAVLRAGEREVSRQTATLRDDPVGQDIPFTYVPDAVGNVVLTVAIEPLEGELLSDNNAKSVTIRAVEEKIRVLYIEGPPRWDYRRLKNLLLRSAEVMDSSCLLLTADSNWLQEGTVRVTALPETFEELYEAYDVVIFGDVDPSHPILSDRFLQDLARFVREGGGLCVLSGPFFTPAAYANSPLAAVLPVDLGDGRLVPEAGGQDPFRVSLTDRGVSHPVFAVADDPERNRALWEQLPSLRWFCQTEGLRPLATALAVHPFRKDRNGAPFPLVAVHAHGRGQALFIGVDETYRWGKGFPERSHLHPFNRFWGQAIRFLATEKLLGGRTSVVLASDKPQYAVGEEALFTARAIDPEAAARLPATLRMIVRRPDQIEVEVPLERREGAEALWQGAMSVSQQGGYRAALPADTAGHGEEPARLEFEASAFSVELQNPRLNREVLDQMAALSDGRVVPWEELGTVKELLESRIEVNPTRATKPWMDMPLGWILLFAAVSAEWIGRKLLHLL